MSRRGFRLLSLPVTSRIVQVLALLATVLAGFHLYFYDVVSFPIQAVGGGFVVVVFSFSYMAIAGFSLVRPRLSIGLFLLLFACYWVWLAAIYEIEGIGLSGLVVNQYAQRFSAGTRQEMFNIHIARLLSYTAVLIPVLAAAIVLGRRVGPSQQCAGKND